ncbi:SRPBCC family protein [Streptomyces sp. ODS28]|uniref:type II toxin-antitoxin system RatA family toxin n=1 Tax=Streptomyces sp. ODS28 TaxID=3136688 RepID=UPI0031EC6B7A
MPRVTLDATVPGLDAAAVFTRLADFTAYPRYTDTVREVIITGAGPTHGNGTGKGSTVASHWSVNFRNGVLCWSEYDRIDPVALTIDFAQLEGDFERFEGGWRVTAEGAHTQVCFTALFDLGIPTLAAILDPVARQALVESISSILRGLFGPHTAVREREAAAPCEPGGSLGAGAGYVTAPGG